MVKNTGIIKRKVFDDYTKKLYGFFVANNASRGNRTPGLTLEGLNVTTTSLTHRFYLHIFRINYIDFLQYLPMIFFLMSRHKE